MVLHSFGKPLEASKESLSLHSQERTQGITSKIGFQHSDEKASSQSIGKRMQGTWNQQSSKRSGQEFECSQRFFRNVEITNTEYMNKVFSNLRNCVAETRTLPKFAVEAYETVPNTLSIWKCPRTHGSTTLKVGSMSPKT